MNTHVIEEKAYCFTENEFSILLSAAGISRIICFDLENGKKQFSELGKRECNEAILSLVQSGVLEIEDEHYLVKEEVKSLIRAIKDCRSVLMYYPSEKAKSAQCVYIKADDCFTIAVSGGMRSDYIRVSYYEGKMLKEYLSEAGILLSGKEEVGNDAEPEGTDRVELYDAQTGKMVYEAEILKRNGIPRELIRNEVKGTYSAESLWEGIEAFMEEKTDDIG